MIDFFHGFDDRMDEKEPEAAKKAEKERARLERRAVIISLYGSKEAALAPC
jgi:hypothetical protein